MSERSSDRWRRVWRDIEEGARRAEGEARLRIEEARLKAEEENARRQHALLEGLTAKADALLQALALAPAPTVEPSPAVEPAQPIEPAPPAGAEPLPGAEMEARPSADEVARLAAKKSRTKAATAKRVERQKLAREARYADLRAELNSGKPQISQFRIKRLAKKHGVSDRAIERDLEALRLAAQSGDTA